MNPAVRAKLERQIAVAATSALSARQVVTPVEVLIGIGWLNAADVEAWRRGRVPYLERVATANLAKLSTALRLLHGWAHRNGLTPSETVYVAWTRDRHRLRFTRTGDVTVERVYCTHWIWLRRSAQGSVSGYGRRHDRSGRTAVRLPASRASAATG